MNQTRIERIESVIDEELDRQAHEGARRIDLHALAERIDERIDTDGAQPSPRQQMRDAKKPSQLNASNDG